LPPFPTLTLPLTQEYALRVLVNLTYSKEAEVQLLAAQQGALG
jgi:hypothetical protein